MDGTPGSSGTRNPHFPKSPEEPFFFYSNDTGFNALLVSFCAGAGSTRNPHFPKSPEEPKNQRTILSAFGISESDAIKQCNAISNLLQSGEMTAFDEYEIDEENDEIKEDNNATS